MENPNYRLETFSDAVFAIALTLLIIEIKIPPVESVHTNKELWYAFGRDWPSWLAFFVSFITILISWVSHDHIFKLIEKSTNKLIYANALLLLCIVTMPFFTTVLAEYIKTDLAGPAVTLYCGFSILLTISWIATQYATLHPASLYKPHVDLKKVKRIFKYTKLGLVLNIITTLLSFWFPITAFVIIALLYIVWLVIGTSIKEEKMANRK
jgi:uncharacterized membrane protein